MSINLNKMDLELVDEHPYAMQIEVRNQPKEKDLIPDLPSKIANFSIDAPPLGVLQKKQVKVFAEQLVEHAEISKEIAKETALKVMLNVFPNQASFIKMTKKQAQLPYGVAIKPPSIFIHEKTYLSEGYFKITYGGLLFDIEQEKMIEIVHQKAHHENFVDAMAKEAELQKHFDHPHIVKIYDYNLYANKEGISIYAEKCDNTLQERMSSSYFAFSQKILIMRDIASALSYIHQQGYVHNDIKLDNILIKDGRGKLSDFGYCHMIGSNYGGFKKIYAPEQKSNAMTPTTDKTDAYQYGLVLWHLFHPNPPPPYSFEYPENLFMDWTASSMEEKAIQLLAFACLNPIPEKRPSMENVQNYLRIIFEKLNQ